MSESGLALYSFSSKEEDEQIDASSNRKGDQLISGLLTAMLEFAKTLGTEIQKIEFMSDILVVFNVHALRIGLMVDKSTTYEELEMYRQIFVELYEKHLSLVIDRGGLPPVLEGTDFEKELKERLNLTGLTIPDQTLKIIEILDGYEEGKFDKNQAAESLFKLTKDFGLSSERNETIENLKTLVEKLGLDEEYFRKFMDLINLYEAHVNKALKKLKSSVFR